MPIPDEAREAAIGALSSAGVVNRGRAEWTMDRVQDALTAHGYTVVKLPSHYAIESAIRAADEHHARTMGKTGVRREHGVAALRQAEASAVLALLRGEGQTDG